MSLNKRRNLVESKENLTLSKSFSDSILKLWRTIISQSNRIFSEFMKRSFDGALTMEGELLMNYTAWRFWELLIHPTRQISVYVTFKELQMVFESYCDRLRWSKGISVTAICGNICAVGAIPRRKLKPFRQKHPLDIRHIQTVKSQTSSHDSIGVITFWSNKPYRPSHFSAMQQSDNTGIFLKVTSELQFDKSFENIDQFFSHSLNTRWVNPLGLWKSEVHSLDFEFRFRNDPRSLKGLAMGRMNGIPFDAFTHKESKSSCYCIANDIFHFDHCFYVVKFLTINCT
jgi:hypothetical protein